MNTNIIAAGQTADTGCRVILWDESEGFSFYPNKKFIARNLSLSELQKDVKTFVIHHAANWTAKQTYVGLLGRGLSVNFIIDDDCNEDGCATIYQCLDIKDAGYSHKPLNQAGPGVEIAVQPAAWQNPNFYSDENIKKYHVSPHEVQEDVVHGTKLKCFGPTEAQHKSLTNLLLGFFKLFPNIPKSFPKDDSNNYIKTTIHQPESYTGILNHYNITNEKVDCLGLDIAKIEFSLLL